MAQRALLIGINEYAIPGANLRGCVNDVTLVADVLRELYGFADAGITMLTDAAATRAAVEAGIEGLVDSAQAGDVLYLHYSGHGSNVPDTNGDEDDGRDEILCPHDLDWNTPLTDDWLRSTFDRLDPGASLTVVMDCCHSGSNTRAPLEAPGAAPAVLQRFLPNPDDLTRGGDHTGRLRRSRRRTDEGDVHDVDITETLVSGCRADQTSADASIGGSFNGALTYYLVQALRQEPTASYRRVHELALGGLKGNYPQVPQLEGRAARLDRPFLSPADGPASPTDAAPADSEADADSDADAARSAAAHNGQPADPVAAVSGDTTPPASLAEPEEDENRPRTRVHMSHGDLRFARNHVLVGHYAGSTLVGGEAALDQLLDGRLSRAAVLGIYPGALETCQVFTDPERWTTPPGAIVAGLGPLGELSAAGLARAVTHAALTAALSHLSNKPHGKALRRTGGVLQMRMSSLLIATGAGGIPVRDSVQAILTGILRANDRLRDTGMGVHISDLELLELWQDRALQALEALRTTVTAGDLAEAFDVPERLEEKPGRQRRLVYQDRTGWWQQVRVRSGDDGSLSFETAVRRAGTPTRTVATQRVLVDRLVESLVDDAQPDPTTAHTLFELLFPNDLKAQAPDTDNLVLVVDRDSAHYPWELLDDREGEAGKPLGVRRGIIRQLEGSSMRSHVLSATTARALVIGDTESGYAPLPGARDEADAVSRRLGQEGLKTLTLIAPNGPQVVQALFDGAYRIVHIAAHGVHDWPTGAGDEAPRVTGVVLGNEMFLTAAEIGQLRRVPEVVFVNACHLGTTTDPGAVADPLSGQYHRLAASFATELIDIGVRVVVACGWAVNDPAASLFATSFYDGLLGGDSFGTAVAQARARTQHDFGEYNTWGAYQCYGDPDYRLVREGVPARDATRDHLASTEQARVAIENLSQSVDVSRDTNFGVTRLQQIVGELTDDDRGDAGLQVLIARTYNKFGKYDRATEYLEKALDAGGSALTVRDVEMWIDQMVHTALTASHDGAAATEAAQTIRSCISRLVALVTDPRSLLPAASGAEGSQGASAPGHPEDATGPDATGSVDRLWRIGSAYKALALVASPARGPDASSAASASGASGADDEEAWAVARDAMVNMAEWYRRAYEGVTRSGRGGPDRREFGTLANWLAAELALSWHPPAGRDVLDPNEARSLLADAVPRADEVSRRTPTFWTVAVVGDLVTLKALWSETPRSQKVTRAVGYYREAARIGSEEQFRAIRNQADFFAAVVPPRLSQHAAFLRRLARKLAQVDEEVVATVRAQTDVPDLTDGSPTG